MRDRHLWFLLSLLAFLLLQPLVAEAPGQGLSPRRVLTSAAVTLVLVAGMWAACTCRRDAVTGLVLAGLALAATWIFPGYEVDPDHAWTDSTWGKLLGACPALFFFYTAGLTLRYVLRGRVNSLNRIYAAISVYLLVGFAFGLLYGFIWEVDEMDRETDPSFGLPEFMGETDPSSGDFIFFSFVTQTTLGYGDITPSSDWARSLSILQTIFAVFYLAVLIARLVASYERQDQVKDSDP